MRIAFWTELYAPVIGGIEILVDLLARELMRRGHEAIVLSNREPESSPRTECVRGVPVHRFDVTRAVMRKDLRRLREECADILALKRAFRPDVEHVHSTGPMLVPHAIARREFATPVVTSLHCSHDLIPGLVAARGAFVDLVRESVVVLTPSELLCSSLVQAMPDLKARVRFEPYGLLSSQTPCAPLSFEPPVVLCLGRLVRDKGFDLALEAIAKVRACHPMLRAIVAGDGPERASLQNLACELGLDGVVQFTGWVQPSDVPSQINHATVVLIPSRWQEPAALVTLESALAGRPVIATAVGGLSELVQHGETGLLVENENIAGMAQALQSLLENPDQTRLLGANACQRARRRYAFERYFETHMDLYTKAATVAVA